MRLERAALHGLDGAGQDDFGRGEDVLRVAADHHDGLPDEQETGNAQGGEGQPAEDGAHAADPGRLVRPALELGGMDRCEGGPNLRFDLRRARVGGCAGGTGTRERDRDVGARRAPDEAP